MEAGRQRTLGVLARITYEFHRRRRQLQWPDEQSWTAVIVGPVIWIMLPRARLPSGNRRQQIQEAGASEDVFQEGSWGQCFHTVLISDCCVRSSLSQLVSVTTILQWYRKYRKVARKLKLYIRSGSCKKNYKEKDSFGIGDQETLWRVSLRKVLQWDVSFDICIWVFTPESDFWASVYSATGNW